MNDITIRPIEVKDKKAVMQMMRVFYDSPAVQHKASDEILEKDIDDCISDMPFIDGFIIEKSGNTAGYFMTAKSYTTEYGGICVWIEDIYINPDYRHSGISASVFDFVEKQYPYAVRFRLEVEPENEFAVRCYQKRKYEKLPYISMSREKSEE